MGLERRKFLQLAAGAAGLPAVPRMARAQAYPSRPIRLIVGLPPGGTTDTFGRLIGQWLSERLGQSIVVENRPGAGTNLAAEAVVRASPDGYTLLLVSVVNTWNAALYDNLRFEFIRDIVPVSGMTRGSQVMVVHPAVPARTLSEFIGYAKANPGKINMASAGTASASHVAGEFFKIMAGVDMVHVPYRGAVPATTDLLSGQVQVNFASAVSSLGHIKEGRLRALAVTGKTRADYLPEIPAINEFVPGYDAYLWEGIGAPKNTPADIVDKLNREIGAGLANPAIRARISQLGSEVLVGSPSDFAKFIADETEKWGKVIRAANIKPE